MKTSYLEKEKSFLNANNIYFVGALVTIVAVPCLFHNQWLTGPLVNAILIATTIVSGPFAALFLGILPSTAALSCGLLSAQLAPMIPFIIISNAILIGAVHFIRKYNIHVSLISAAFLKTAFLVLIAYALMPNFLDSKIIENLIKMMTWPQLITALVGGIIAYTALKFSKKL